MTLNGGQAPAVGTPVQVQTLDAAVSTKLGVDGPVVQLQAPVGAAAAAGRLTLDYGKFADLAGGDWSSRLQVVAVPDCAMAPAWDRAAP